MSAKRRQEAISRFSVPLAPQPKGSQDSIDELDKSTSRRPSRKVKGKRSTTIEDVVDGSSDDGEFMAQDEDNDSDESSDDALPSFSQGKGKNKGKGKEVSQQYPRDLDFDDSDANPKVMLLSLKAVGPFLWPLWTLMYFLPTGCCRFEPHRR